MEQQEIAAIVRRLITGITKIPADRIEDHTSFRTELLIDSLSLIEIGVSVDYEFRLNYPEEAFQEIDTLTQTVALVERQLAARTAGATAAG